MSNFNTNPIPMGLWEGDIFIQFGFVFRTVKMWIFIVMAEFNVHFLDSDNNLSILTQEDNNINGNVNDVAIDDIEELINSSKDSAVRSLASLKGDEDSDQENNEIIPIAQ